MTENNTFYCSFVGNQYIICECGETFPGEDTLRLHLEKDPPHQPSNKANQTFTEYKCGECGNIYATEKECVDHQDVEHIPYLKDEHSYMKDVELFVKDKKLYLKTVKETNSTNEPYVKQEPLYADIYAEDETPYVNDVPEYITEEVDTSFIKNEAADVEHETTNIEGEMEYENEMGYVENDMEYVETETAVVEDETLVIDNRVYVGKRPIEEVRVYSKPNVTVSVSSGQIGTNIQENKSQPDIVAPNNKTICNVGPRTRRKKQSTEGSERKNRNQKNVVCEVCGKKYASNAALRYHQRVHTGVRPFQCPFCPKNFTMGLFLQIHIRTHTGERPYQCTQCPKAFSNRAALLRHDRVHTGEKPYECPKCGKFFTQSNSMKLHVHTVHLKMPAPYKSARRKAESRARAARARPPDAAQMQIIKTDVAGTQVDESYTTLGDTEVYYCDIPAKEEEVTYELIYE